jgi:glutamate/tyrosine decarboxylase-like PLP-dependent enzyme
MASFSGLAAARHHVLKQHGWNVEQLGLQGAPRLRVLASDERHVTIDASLRYLGLGSETTQLVATDGEGRMDVADLRTQLSTYTGPTIVCLAAGNVNTGAFDDFHRAIAVSHEHDAWVHVDGAFGLWAAATPTKKSLTSGVENADSWSTDAHKWLNVPYDSGIVFIAHPASHRETFQAGAAYLVQDAVFADPMEFVPEFSRRARGFAVWAALRSMGREGVAALGERLCANARLFEQQLTSIDGCEVVNEVVLNQVLVRFDDDDELTRQIVDDVVSSGVAYVGPTTFKGRGGMRISVCNGWTNADDVEMTVAAISTALDKRRGNRLTLQ